MLTDSVNPSLSKSIQQLCVRSQNVGYIKIGLTRKPNVHDTKSVIRFIYRFFWYLFSRIKLKSHIFPKALERSEALVTGRYHAVAYAILLKKKFLAIESNTPKITFLLNDVGFDNSRIIEIKEDAKELPFIPDFTKEEIEKLDNFLIMAKKCRENLEKDLLAVVYKNSAYV